MSPRSQFQVAKIAGKAAGVVLGLAVVVVIALLIGRLTGPQKESQQQPNEPEVDVSSGVFELAESAFPSSAMEPRWTPLPNTDSDEAELTPDEVIDKLSGGCSVEMGEGPAADLAIVVTRVPNGSIWGGTKFSVLNQSGAVHSGVLPFLSFQVGLGKTPQGQVVAGFGGILLANPNNTGLYADGEPLRIYIDDRMVYEKERVWLFDVANDGSSYFFIESLGSDYSSRLVIADLEQGTETHHYLGTLFAHPEHDLTYLASYASGSEEVHLQPISARYTKGLGTHYFFKAQGGGEARWIRVADTGRYDRAHFTSSEEAYLLFEGASALKVVKYRIDWTAREAIPVWHAQGAAGLRASVVRTSPNGAWLLFRTATASTADRGARNADRVLYVLDAATGEAVFMLPTLHKGAQLRQLSSVLPPQATEDDVGWYNGAFFAGNDKLVVRRFRDTDGVIDRTVKYYDVYDMNSISLDAQPEYRVEGNEHWQNPCPSAGFPGTLIAGEDGRLAYARRLQ